MYDMTLKQLDELVGEYVDAREKYDIAKSLSNEAAKIKSNLEMQLLQALKIAEKKSYIVVGIGTISTRERLVVRVPQGDKKREFLKYLQDKGEEVFYGLATVNFNTLNSFYASEMEAAQARNEFPFIVPGLEDPVLNEGITFRRNKK